MPSLLYKAAFAAIRRKSPVRFLVKGKLRLGCPHVLGTSGGEEKLFVFQTSGFSSGPLPGWRCFPLKDIESLEQTTGSWRTGTSHKQRHSCVKEVDIDVNPNAMQRYLWPRAVSAGKSGAKKRRSAKKRKSPA